MISGKVYGLYDPRNGEIRYVGQTIKSLKDRHALKPQRNVKNG